MDEQLSLSRSTSGTPLSWWGQRALNVLEAGWREGALAIDLPDGTSRVVGAGQPAARWHLRREKALWRALFHGDLGFAESWMLGEWDTEDLTALLMCLARNERPGADVVDGWSALRWLDRVHHWRRRNTRDQSRRNIASHYDLGNDFYAAWLDDTMTYSAAMFESPDEPLNVAQARKYAHLAKLIGLAPGQSVLEIGCGWGGFAEHAVRSGASVHGISLSQAQTAYATQRLAAIDPSGEHHRLEIRDYRDLDAQYDAIASIEMLEAVGERYWPTYAATLKRALKPGGKAGIQTITIAPSRFESYRRRPDFIQRYIFPGGMLPTEPGLDAVLREAGLRITGTVRFGDSYATTLVRWRQRFDEAWPRLAGGGFDERFRRMWLYYLAYCEAGFRLGTIDVVQLRIEHA